MRNTKIKAVLSLALLANTACDTSLLDPFSKNCRLENVQDSWVSDESQKTIIINLRNFLGKITEKGLYPSEDIYDSSKNPLGEDYSLRVLDHANSILYASNFSFLFCILRRK